MRISNSHKDRLQHVLSRVRISWRLAIASIVLLVPVLVFGYLYVQSKADAIHAAQLENEGLEFLSPLGEFMRHAAQHRGLSNVYLHGNHAVLPKIRDVANRIEKNVAALDDLDARLGGKLQTHNRWAAIKLEWSALKQDTSGLTPDNSFSRHTVLIAQALDLNRIVAEMSGMVLHPRPETYYLVDATVLQGTDLAEKIGQLRGRVSGLVQLGKLDAAERTRITSNVAVVNEQFESIKRSLAGLYRYAPALKREIDPGIVLTEQKLRRFLGYLEMLARNEPLPLTAPELFDAGTAALDEYNKVKDVADAIFRRGLDKAVVSLARDELIAIVLVVSSILLAFFTAFVSARSVVQPIRHLTDTVNRLVKGDDNARTGLDTGDEIGQLAKQFDSMLDERKRSDERIQYLADHDALTTLPNRSMFSGILNVAIRLAQRYKRQFAIMFIDLDRFKVINDSLGHHVGDTILQQMAARLTQCLRASDVVARLGGDEFVVLLQEANNPDDVAKVAHKLLSAAMKPIAVQGQEYRVTASIGICLYPKDGADEPTLMKNADIAMYLAKEEGKNNFQFYIEQTKIRPLERLTLEMDLGLALERNEFLLHYQAKLDLQTGLITGAEALIRWQHPTLGMVSPLQFISLAEEAGLIVPIGKWVLRTACMQNVAWQKAGLPPLCMAVNLSPRQFSDEHLLADLANILRETGMRPELLEFEITEGMVMQNVERAMRLLSAIKAMGVRLAIDDFGTGYSSLSQIKRFPIDTLKIDRSLIRDIATDPDDRAIAEAIIAMGKTLSLTIVAEGVETKEQAMFLRDHACDEMQGYYFSKPVPSDQFAELQRRTAVSGPS